ncbi:MAG: hypothetical protein F4X31_02860, partial [Gammaproteobacteria bacterium]|nr:hypothetical protein [Gammaproteobacteria bacterium]
MSRAWRRRAAPPPDPSASAGRRSACLGRSARRPGLSFRVGFAARTASLLALLILCAAGAPAQAGADDATATWDFSGLLQVGNELTIADLSVQDPDGTSGAVYSYQWLDADNEEILGATEITYTIAEMDAGGQLGLKLSFQDDAGNQESIVLYTGTRIFPLPRACTAGNLWCATLTIGGEDTSAGHGYCDKDGVRCDDLGSGGSNQSYGDLSVTTFALDSVTYKVNSLRWGTSDNVRLFLILDRDIPQASLAELALMVHSASLPFRDATRSNTNDDIDHLYRWSKPMLLNQIQTGIRLTVEILPTGPGVILNPKALTVAEAGGAGTYTVGLNTEPAHDVTVAVTSGDATAATVDKAGGSAGASQTLTFTAGDSGNWAAAQTITVTGVDDAVDNANDRREVTIAHAASSTDTDYAIADAGSVTVTVTDDDGSANTDTVAPTVEIGGLSGTSGAVTVTIAFSEDVTGFTVGDIMVTNGAVSNFAGSGAAYTATITPADGGMVTSLVIAAGAAADAANNGNKRATANNATVPR